MQFMHEYTDETEEMARALVAYARNRIAAAQPLDNVVPAAELDKRAGATVTASGIGWEEALRLWGEVLAPATISTDHPAALAFVPGAPTKASVLFDLIVGASSTIAAGWIDGAGAIWAENQALAWLANAAGHARRRRRRVRERWLGREPVGAGGRAARGGRRPGRAPPAGGSPPARPSTRRWPRPRA